MPNKVNMIFSFCKSGTGSNWVHAHMCVCVYLYRTSHIDQMKTVQVKVCNVNVPRLFSNSKSNMKQGGSSHLPGLRYKYFDSKKSNG